MAYQDEAEVDGVMYRSERHEWTTLDDMCMGCVAVDCYELCNKMPKCCEIGADYDIIWVKK